MKKQTAPKLSVLMSAQVYRRSPGVSKSELDTFAKCPLKYKAERDGDCEREETPQMLFGTLLHSAVLDGKFDYWVKPDGLSFASKDGKSWREDHQDKPIISQSDDNEIHTIAKVVRSHRLAGPLLDGVKTEVSMWGIDAESGLQIKGRADIVGAGYIADIKTTADASNRALSRSIFSFRYHVQAAMYLKLARQNGLDAASFIFIAIERGDVPLINVRKLSPAAIELGEMTLRKNLLDLAECERSGIWPDYCAESVAEIDVPQFAYTDTTGAEVISIPTETMQPNELDLTP